MARAGQPGLAAGEEYLRIDEAAAIMKCSRPTVYRRIAAGLLDRVDIGTPKRPKTRIPRSSLDRYLASCLIPARKAA